MVQKSKKVSSVSLFSSTSDNLATVTSSLHQGVLIDEIKQIATTKKALWSLEDKKYTFLASPFVTKEWMKRAIESCYNVRVIKINTSNLPTKKKRVAPNQQRQWIDARRAHQEEQARRQSKTTHK